MKNEITPNLLKEFIKILEIGTIPYEQRFKLLRECYLQEAGINSKCITKFKMAQHLNEIQRLYKINASDGEIQQYIKSVVE